MDHVSNDFYETDESIADVLAVTDRAPDGHTERPALPGGGYLVTVPSTFTRQVVPGFTPALDAHPQFTTV